MEIKLKIFLILCIFVVFLFIFITTHEFLLEVYNYVSFKSNNNSNIDNGSFSKGDGLFSQNLWRSEPNISRWEFQKNWAVNVARSDFIKAQKKKRILVIGLFNLDDTERTLPCAEPGINFSSYCELVDYGEWDPRYPNYDEFDAVLSRRDWNYQFYEPRVPPSKISIYHIQESPYTFHQGDFRVNNPILASYWRGSDIYVPYYKYIPPPSDQETKTIKPTMKDYASGKRKFAAMVASHCPTYNDRLGLVNEIRKFIPIDVFGKCGSPCENDCIGKVQREYKFYLAFENANCRDYITEKFFRTGLGSDIIPIVLGAHPDDYKAAAPPHSYIHVEDFLSIKSLAEYLIILDNNDTLYNEYFEWKRSGAEIVKGKDDLFCRICAFLFYADYNKPPKWSEDAYSWLNVNKCLKPGKYFWLRD